MHAITKAVFILTSLAGLASVHAAPTEEAAAEIDPVAVFQPTGGLKFLSSETVNGHKLYWFGADNDTAADMAVTEQSSHVKRQCSNSQLRCYNMNVPDQVTCARLLVDLGHPILNYFPIALDTPRAACISDDVFGQCCVSWLHPVSAFLRDISAAAIPVWNGCMWFNRYQAGIHSNVDLAGECNTVCMFNRAAPCYADN